MELLRALGFPINVTRAGLTAGAASGPIGRRRPSCRRGERLPSVAFDKSSNGQVMRRIATKSGIYTHNYNYDLFFGIRMFKL
jgi:hypothetical protein